VSTVVDSYTRVGKGEPLLLVHGIGSRRQVWDPFLPALVDRHEVIAVDLPGFNGTSNRGVDPTVSGYADALGELCKELDLGQPRVAGHSLGGAIALELGRRGAARSVVAFAPIGFWGASGTVWCQSALRATRFVGPGVRPVVGAMAKSRLGRVVLGSLFYGRPHRLPSEIVVADAEAVRIAESFAAACTAFGEFVFTDVAMLDSIPVTVAWGTRDALLPFWTQSRRARKALPNALHVRLSGCGHVPFLDDPESCGLLLSEEWTASRG